MVRNSKRKISRRKSVILYNKDFSIFTNHNIFNFIFLCNPEPISQFQKLKILQIYSNINMSQKNKSIGSDYTLKISIHEEIKKSTIQITFLILPIKSSAFSLNSTLVSCPTQWGKSENHLHIINIFRYFPRRNLNDKKNFA